MLHSVIGSSLVVLSNCAKNERLTRVTVVDKLQRDGAGCLAVADEVETGIL